MSHTFTTRLQQQLTGRAKPAPGSWPATNQPTHALPRCRLVGSHPLLPLPTPPHPTPVITTFLSSPLQSPPQPLPSQHFPFVPRHRKHRCQGSFSPARPRKAPQGRQAGWVVGYCWALRRSWYVASPSHHTPRDTRMGYLATPLPTKGYTGTKTLIYQAHTCPLIPREDLYRW